MTEIVLSYPTESASVALEQSSKEITQILVHELAQPLTAISIYIWGCIHRLMNGTQDRELILHAMNKVIQDIECAQQIAGYMEHCILQTEIN